MSSSDRGWIRGFALLALSLLGAACARGPGPEHQPQPRRLVPSWGMENESVPVIIEGENFLALATQHLGKGEEPVSMDARFEAFLGEVPLEDVTLEDARTLRARVPAGLALGWHALALVGPLGRRMVLPRAWYVSNRPLARLGASAALEQPVVSEGQETRLLLTVENTGETLARAVTPVLHVAGEGRLEISSAPGPVDIAPGAVASFAWALRGVAAGEVRLSLEVRGREASAGVWVESPRVEVAPLRVQAPSVLTAAISASPAVVNEGQRVTVSLTVTNTGGSTAREVVPEVPQVWGTSAVLVSGPEPSVVDIPSGEHRGFVWTYTAGAAGTLAFQAGALGRDIHSGAESRAPRVRSADLTVLRPGALSVRPTVPASVNVGQEFELLLEVDNPGQSQVLGVTPAELVPSVAGLTTRISGPEPASADIPGGSRTVFRWRLAGALEGACTFRAGAGGTDGTDGARVESSLADSSPLSVQRPAALLAMLSAPPVVGLGSTFQVYLSVFNTGGAMARGVLPTALRTSSDAVVLASAPSFAPVELPGGAVALYTWSYRAVALGSASFSASVSGTDGNTGAALSTGEVSSEPVSIREVVQMLSDPFGDGTTFAHLVRYGGRLYLGPNRDGTGGVSVAPDGTAGRSFRFSFPRDTNGNSSQNKSGAPYPSIGAKGCTSDTPACGPDNEDGRGFLFSGLVGAQEWLGIGGARSGGDLDYIYLTQDTGGVLSMRYLDLSPFLGSQTRGFSSALFFHNRLYLGFLDTGGSRPYFTRISTLPTAAPGYDPSQGLDGEDLQAQNMPGIGSGGTPQNKASAQMIDTLAVFNARLYLANNGGCVRSTTPTPRSWGTAVEDWASCTPSLEAWSARASRVTTKTSDFEPADRAVPRMAVFQGRLYLARNTTAGPQLFVCEPARSGSAGDCDPGDWTLVAPNSAGDTLLTQFDNPDNVSLSLLEATAGHLYVGFDNEARGVVLLRASTATPLNRADFQGAGGCSAARHPATCSGLGGNGLGVGAQRLFDGVTLGSAEGESLYLAAGDGTGPVRIFRLVD